VSLLNTYNLRVTHRRPTQSAGSYGNTGAATTPVIRAALGIRLEQLGARELDMFGKTTGEIDHIAYIGSNVDVREEDEFVSGTRVYRVVSVNRMPGGLKRHKEVMLKEYAESS